MIESPVIQELVEEVEQKATQKATYKAKQDDILLVLEGRLGSVPQDVKDAVQRVEDEASLKSLIQLAARCPDLVAFRQGLAPSVR